MDDFQNNAIVLFYQLPYIHTCKLKFDIFILRWDMVDQKNFPNGYPYKFYASPPYYSVHFIFFDVIADNEGGQIYCLVGFLIRLVEGKTKNC